MPDRIHNIVYQFSQELNKIIGKKLSKIIVYGSYARGDYNCNSDVDIMILVKAINEEVSFLKKKEAVFIGALLVISVVLCIFVYAVPHGTHGSIQIMVDGELYGTYSLAEDQVIQIGDTNVCEIKDGEVKMTDADCPDHLCMKQPAVGSAGGYIVCLPNRVVIQGEGDSDSQDSESGFDAVV